MKYPFYDIYACVILSIKENKDNPYSVIEKRIKVYMRYILNIKEYRQMF